MISFAKNKNKNKIINLWNICFNENLRFTNWFFNNIYKSKQTLVYKQNNEIISMIQMIPIKIYGYNITYIYGACTLPKYQNQGLMKQLLLKSFNIDNSNNVKASVLIPQNKKLFDFYKKFGYQKNFYINKKYINYNENFINKKIYFKIADINDLININILYNHYKFFTNRSFLYFKKQLDLFYYMKNNVYCLYNQNKQIISYAFVLNENNNIIIQELIGSEVISHYIMKNFSLKKILVYTPINSKNNISKIANGSLKIYNNNNPKLIKKLKTCNYLNLVFN